MDLNLKSVNTVVIDHSRGEINIYKGDNFSHSMIDSVMKDCSVDVCDEQIKIEGKYIKYKNGLLADLEGMSGKDIRAKFFNISNFSPNPRVKWVGLFKKKIVRDWAFKKPFLALQPVRAVKILSLNKYDVNLYRDELDNN